MVCNVSATVYIPVDSLLWWFVSSGVRRVHPETPATLCTVWRSAHARHDRERVPGPSRSKHFSRAVHAKVKGDAFLVH